MSIVVKSQTKSSIEFRIKGEDGLKSKMIQPGRNIITEEEYAVLKEHSGFMGFLNKDVITINTEGASVQSASKEPDFSYVEGLIGKEDGKDILKEYALAWSITLNKKMNIENMVADFKEQYKGK